MSAAAQRSPKPQGRVQILQGMPKQQPFCLKAERLFYGRINTQVTIVSLSNKGDVMVHLVLVAVVVVIIAAIYFYSKKTAKAQDAEAAANPPAAGGGGSKSPGTTQEEK